MPRKRKYRRSGGRNDGKNSAVQSGSLCHGSNLASNTTTNSHPETPDETPELPGFYYDREKKKYFRIVSSGNNAMAGAMTREAVEAKRSEEKRLAVLSERTLDVKQRTKARGKILSNNFLCMLQDMQLGYLSANTCSARMVNSTVRNLSHLGSMKVSFEWAGPYSYHPKQLLLSSEENQFVYHWQDSVGCRNSRGAFYCKGGDLLHRINICDFQKKRRRRISLRAELAGFLRCSNLQQITSLCFAETPLRRESLATASDTSKPVLYTAFGLIGSVVDTGVAVLHALDSSLFFDNTNSFQTYNVGQRWIWSSAWNFVQSSNFVVGTEKKSMMFDAETGQHWLLDTKKSDALSQVVSADSDVLYTGTRSGAIYCYRSQQCVGSLQQTSSVYSLHLTADNHHLIAADFNGKIVNWDLRQNRVALEYGGHVNDTAVFATVGVEKHDRILYAVGSDGMTRLWDIRTGEHLKTVAPPCPTYNFLPSVCYSQSFGRNLFPGLLLGIQENLYLYSL